MSNIKIRYDNGDQFVIDTLKEIADIAEQGKQAIRKRNYEELHELMNRNFDLREKIMTIREADKSLVDTARQCRASAKFTGSGGSIIGMYHDDEMLNRLKVELKKVKARVIKPFIL